MYISPLGDNGQNTAVLLQNKPLWSNRRPHDVRGTYRVVSNGFTKSSVALVWVARKNNGFSQALEPLSGAPTRENTSLAPNSRIHRSWERVKCAKVQFAMTLEGALLGGTYRIGRVLGEGGMAVVYAATHVHTEQKCAVKVVREDVARRHPWLVEKFVAEAKVTARIGNCAHIVQVTDANIDRDRGVPYLVMELLSGETLEALIERGPVPRELVAVVMDHLGEALDLAHAAGVVHRDLKPANLFLTVDYKNRPILKVADFGIAKLLADGPANTGTQIGTPGYGAPEQLGLIFGQIAAAQGVSIARAVSTQTDVWPLALIAYDLLTGHPYGQFWGVSPGEISAYTVIHVAPKPSERAGDRASLLPVGFDAWAARCLERDATKRWSSAGAALEAFADLFRRSTTSMVASTVYTQPSTLVPAVSAPIPSSGTTGRPIVQAGTLPMDPQGDAAPQIPNNPAFSPGTSSDLKRSNTPLFIGIGVVVASLGVVGVMWKSSAQRVDSSGSSASVQPAAPEPTKPPKVVPVAPLAKALAPKPGSGAMVKIPGGTFQMGDGERADSQPIHSVTVTSFELDETEVTVAAYQACVYDSGCTTEGVTGFKCNWGGAGSHPMNCIDWTQSEAFCKWAGKRLPTEEEWEYAARKGAEGRKYPWGSAHPEYAEGQWRRLCWERTSDSHTCEVGKYASTDDPWGLKDMAGNVYEWTASGWSDDYSTTRVKERRVYRGGGWSIATGSGVRSAYRGADSLAARSNYLGVRCAANFP